MVNFKNEDFVKLKQSKTWFHTDWLRNKLLYAKRLGSIQFEAVSYSPWEEKTRCDVLAPLEHFERVYPKLK